MPPELDAQIRAEASREGATYSAWLADAARKELAIRAGLDAVTEVERELGVFTIEELAETEQWAREATARSRHSGLRTRRAA